MEINQLSEQIKQLISRFLDGEASEQEVAFLKQWLTISERNRALFDQLNQDYQVTKMRATATSDSRIRAWTGLKERMEDDVSITQTAPRKYLFSSIRVAASVALILLIGYTTLKLINAGGQGIQQPMIVQTAHQTNRDLYLPDSTHVWLNKNSTLEYPASFSNTSRLVVLKGEAFFDVQKNGRPFVVQTEKVQVLVKGTRFNIQAYGQEPSVKTTLEEGKVELQVGDHANHYTMTPGDQVTLDKPLNQITRRKVDPSNYTAWKEPRLIFDNVSLKDMVAKLENRYRVDFTIKRRTAANERFSMTIENESLEEILEMLQLSSNLQISTDNNRIVIY